MEQSSLTDALKMSIQVALGAWDIQNSRLVKLLESMPEGRLSDEIAVSETDFAKEPNRNKLNLLLNRTGHIAYHLGQLV